jgi:hypothetical protein
MMAFMITAFAVIGIFSSIEPGFFWLLPFVPMGLILVHPVWKAMNEPGYRQKFVDVINTRAIVLAALMLAVYGIVRFTGY